MSEINGVSHTHHVRDAAPVAAAPPVAHEAPAASADPLQALQGLIKQLGSAANTRAIPAHQGW